MRGTAWMNLVRRNVCIECWKFHSRNIATASTSGKKFIPRRAMLYVPGSEEKKIKKATTLGADCVVLDCEDGVALNRKEEARTTILKALEEYDFGTSECAVRINSVDSGLADMDLKVILKSKRLPSTLFVPKVETQDHISWIADRLNRLGLPQNPKLNLVIFTESARGLLQLASLCQRTVSLSESAPFVLDGVVFGSDDYCADIGASRSPEATELVYARQHVVAVAKAFRLQAIDVVYINYKDLDGLRRQSEEGARMGFTGKQVIHPGQVDVVQTAFSPSPEKVEWATELVTAFGEHQKSGKGAFTFRGQMIDMPLVLQAKNILHLAKMVAPSEQ